MTEETPPQRYQVNHLIEAERVDNPESIVNLWPGKKLVFVRMDRFDVVVAVALGGMQHVKFPASLLETNTDVYPPGS